MIGKYPAKLDDKNRLFVPAKLRAEMGEDFFVTVGINCGRSCLTIYTAKIGKLCPRITMRYPSPNVPVLPACFSAMQWNVFRTSSSVSH